MSITFSFEFFPPKTPELEEGLKRAVAALMPLNPAFVSVTYGAGGSTRDRTHRIVTDLQQKGLNAAAHLTCVGASQAEIGEIARKYWENGIRHIVALRGDPPEGEVYKPHPEGFASTAALVKGLKQIAPFEVSVGGYPEIHPEAGSADADIQRLKEKVDAGADRVITQFFFENDVFFRFLERADKAGIKAPIVPGILPVTNFARASEFAGKCNTTIPAELKQLFQGFDQSPPPVRKKLAEEVATEQCLALKANGVTHFHFYTLNRSDLVKSVCEKLKA